MKQPKVRKNTTNELKRKAEGAVKKQTRFKNAKMGKYFTGANAEQMIDRSKVIAAVKNAAQDLEVNVESAQISELLNEVVYTTAQRAAIHSRFERLSSVIDEVQHIPYKKLEVHLPKRHYLKKTSRRLLKECQYIKPVSVELCGSYVHGILLNRDSATDINVIIPRSYFREKDYLNERWIYKKYYYMAIIAHHLRTTHKLEYFHPNSHPLNLSLKVQGNTDMVAFHIHFKLEIGTFSMKRLLLKRNNVRPSYLELQSEEGMELSPTPLYNHTLMESLSNQSVKELYQRYFYTNQSVKSAVCLIKLWAKQHNITQGWGSVTSFQLTLLVLYFLKNNKLPTQASPFRIFRSFLEQLGQLDWTVVHSFGNGDTDGWLNNNNVVLLDQESSFNYLYTTTLLSAQQLSTLAGTSLETLKSMTGERAFPYLFIKKTQSFLQYDELIRIDDVSSLTCIDQSVYVATCGDVVSAALTNIVNTLQTALNDRITNIHILPINRCTIPVVKDSGVNSIKLSEIESNSITIGLSVDPSRVSALVRRGPSADNNQKSAEFRDFWGGKSNLRRFMDGGICEAVVWEEDSKAGLPVLTRIIEYVLHRHCQINSDRLSFSAPLFRNKLTFDDYSVRRHESLGVEEMVHVKLAYNELTKTLRGLTNLPLDIVDVYLNHETYRNTQVLAPLPRQGNYAYPPFKVTAVLEGSGKWPSDAEAIHALKVIFLFGIKDQLVEIFEENSIYMKKSSLTIKQNGHLFDILLMHRNDLTSLKREHDSAERFPLYIEHILHPQLSTSIAGLDASQGCYSLTARFVKRWAGVNMLLSLIPELVFELITSHVFLQPEPYMKPNSLYTSFLRVLMILSTHDFTNEPLILNINDDLTDETRNIILKDFTDNRSSYPSLTIITKYDTKSDITRQVQPFILKLLSDTATQTLNKVEPYLEKRNFDFKIIELCVMSPPDSTRFNILMELNDSNRRHEGVTCCGTLRLYVDSADNFVKHIQEAYGDEVIVLYDKYNYKYIGLIFKPNALKPQHIQHIQGCDNLTCKRLIEDDGEIIAVQFSVDCMIEDLNISGRLLISQMTINLPDVY